MSSRTNCSNSLPVSRHQTPRVGSASSASVHMNNSYVTSSGHRPGNNLDSMASPTILSSEEDAKLLESLPRPKRRVQKFPLVKDDQIDIYLNALAERYSINRDLVERLRNLEDYEIVILCDDSGSMKTHIGTTSKTRWQELQEIVRIIFFISIVFDENGVDLYFLNRESIENVTTPSVIDQAFAKPPRGYSNLSGALKYLFTSEKAKPENDKSLLIFVATDAEPTNEQDKADLISLEEVMLKDRNPETTHVMFLLCNNNPKCFEYLSRWDKTMDNVDFTADYEAERTRIEKLRGQPFSFGDYIVKALLGAIDDEMDALNDEDEE